MSATTGRGTFPACASVTVEAGGQGELQLLMERAALACICYSRREWSKVEDDDILYGEYLERAIEEVCAVGAMLEATQWRPSWYASYRPIPVPGAVSFPPMRLAPRPSQELVQRRREIAAAAVMARHGHAGQKPGAAVSDQEADAIAPRSGPGLRRWRESLGLTQRVVAECAGISQGLLTQIEGEPAQNKWYGSRQRVTAALAKYVASAGTRQG